ncbi:chemotaxis protein CheW [bacterium]|nr:chemotaxis protein CheW [bacterium]
MKRPRIDSNSAPVLKQSLEELLQERADRLAEKASQGDYQPDQMTQIVIFSIQQEMFGLELPFIYEVIDFPRTVPLYQASTMLQGVFHYRGEIVPLYLLSAILGYHTTSYHPTGRCIVLGVDCVHFAIAIDSIAQPRTIPRRLLTGLTSGPNSGKKAYILGIIDEGITILDGQAIIDDTALIIDHQET